MLAQHTLFDQSRYTPPGSGILRAEQDLRHAHGISRVPGGFRRPFATLVAVAKERILHTIAPIVQPPSSKSDPELGWERSAFDPRRYLMQKKMIGRKMIVRKKSDTAMSAKKRASTSCDIVEACGGKRRN